MDPVADEPLTCWATVSSDFGAEGLTRMRPRHIVPHAKSQSPVHTVSVFICVSWSHAVARRPERSASDVRTDNVMQKKTTAAKNT